MAMFGPCWAMFGPCWAMLLGHLGQMFSHVRPMGHVRTIGPCWADVVGPSLADAGPQGAHVPLNVGLGGSWSMLISWADAQPCWAYVEPCWANAGTAGLFWAMVAFILGLDMSV